MADVARDRCVCMLANTRGHWPARYVGVTAEVVRRVAEHASSPDARAGTAGAWPPGLGGSFRPAPFTMTWR